MSDDSKDRSAHLQRYTEHAKRLQTWITGYGAGLAVLLIYHFRSATEIVPEKLREFYTGADAAYIERMISFKLRDMRDGLGLALGLITLALIAQVVILVVNKFAQLTLARRNEGAPLYSLSRRISDSIVLEFLFDVASIVLLWKATVQGFTALNLLMWGW